MPAPIPFISEPAPARRPGLKQLAQCVLLALLATGTGSVAAQVPSPSHFEEDFDDANKQWQEIAVQLPAAPKMENLLEFEVSNTTTQTFAVDAKSISVGEDGVVRYILVSRSPSGAKNVSYEGIRCETWERKLYAFGHKDGSWTRSRRDQWERFTGTVANRQHATLARDYFCQSGRIEGTVDQITRRLRDRQRLSDTPFSGA